MNNTSITLVHLIIIKGDKILFAFRNGTKKFNFMYSLPGGKVEANERPIDAACREAKEELNIYCYPNNVQLFVSTDYFDKDNSITYHNFYYKIMSYEGKIMNKEPEKCSKLEFFPFNQIPADCIIPFIYEDISKILRAS